MVYKNNTVKMVFNNKFCFNFVIKFELGGLVAEQFCDEGCVEILKYTSVGNFGFTLGKNSYALRCYHDTSLSRDVSVQ